MTAAPETETDANGIVELTYDERTTLAVAIHDLPANPCQCTHVYAAVERIVAERVRVVEGERDFFKAEADEWKQQADINLNRKRAESAEAAHEALVAGVEALASRLLHFDALNEQVPAHVDVPDDYEAGVNEAGRYLRALLAGGGA